MTTATEIQKWLEKSGIRIRWKGWEITYSALLNAGWMIDIKVAYENWRTPCIASHHKIYLRHPSTAMIARLSFCGFPAASLHDIMADSDLSRTYYEVDFMTHNRSQRIKPKKVIDEVIEEATCADIPALLEMVAHLQEPERQRIRAQRKPGNVVGFRPEATNEREYVTA